MSDRIFSSCETNIKINRSWENQAILKILDVFPIDVQRLCLGGNHWHFKCKSRYRDNICQSCRPKLGIPCSHEWKLQEKKRQFFYCHIKSAYWALISLSNYAFAYWIIFWQIICIWKQSGILNMLLESGALDCSPRSATVWDVTLPFCSLVDSPTIVWLPLYTGNFYNFWYNAMRLWSCIGLLSNAGTLKLQKQGIFKGGIT